MTHSPKDTPPPCPICGENHSPRQHSPAPEFQTPPPVETLTELKRKLSFGRLALVESDGNMHSTDTTRQLGPILDLAIEAVTAREKGPTIVDVTSPPFLLDGFDAPASSPEREVATEDWSDGWGGDGGKAPPVETLTEAVLERIETGSYVLINEDTGLPCTALPSILAAAREAVTARELAAKCLEAMEPENDEDVLEQIAYPMRERLKGYDTSVRDAPTSSSERGCPACGNKTFSDKGCRVCDYLVHDIESSAQPRLSQDDEELVKRLLADKHLVTDISEYHVRPLSKEAAARIQSLSAKNRHLKQALAQAGDSIELQEAQQRGYARAAAQLSSCRSEVERLRKAERQGYSHSLQVADIVNAGLSRENSALRADNDALRGATENLISAAVGMPMCHDNLCQGTLDQAVEDARAALSPRRQSEEGK